MMKVTKSKNKTNITSKYGVFYFDRGRWNGPANGELFAFKNGEVLSEYRSSLKKKVRFATAQVWSLDSE